MRSALFCALALAAGIAFAGADPTTARRGDFAEKNGPARSMVQLRDRWFLLNPAGRGCVNFYYRYSPYATFALGQEERGRLKILAASGIAGLQYLFRGAFLWMPAAGALVMVWLAALAAELLRRRPGLAEFLQRHRTRLLAGAALAFLVMVAAVWLRPAEIAKRTRLETIRAAAAAGEIPPDMIAACRADPDPDLRYEILYALAEHPAPEDFELFRTALEDLDLRVRCWAMNGLGNLADARAVPELERRLSDPIYNVRYRAAWALGAIGDPAAIGPLTDTEARDEHVYVRYYASAALEQIAERKK